MTNLEKASNQRPAKKKHVPKLNDENDWRLEPELPDDMRLWRTFSDSLAIFPQHDNKVKGTDTRKDAVFRMLRFLISSTNNIGSPSTPPYCCNCRGVVLGVKEEIVKKIVDLPLSKELVPPPDEDPIPGMESPPHFFESDSPCLCGSAFGPDESVCSCVINNILDDIIPEGAVPDPHLSAPQDHPAKTLPPIDPGSNSSPPEPHAKKEAPANDDSSPSLSFPKKNDIANLSEENDITYHWNDSGDVTPETSLF
jgi:hypothetical protein